MATNQQEEQPQEIHVMALEQAAPPPPQPNPAAPAADVLPGAPGTLCSLVFRTVQCVAAVLAVVAMASTGGFATNSAFGFLLAASSLQSAWSFSLGLLDLDVLVTKSPLRTHWVASLFIYGDIITGTLSFCAASASSGNILSFRENFHACAVNPCAKYQTATAWTLISFAALLPSIVVNWWMRG